MIIQTKSIVRVGLITAVILLIPLVAMQFTQQVNWTLSDFVVMGSMLLVAGLLLEIALEKAGKYRIPAVTGIVGIFLWLWVELAVGLFTNWGS